MAISRSKAFELIISIVIVLNCITLALQTNKGSQLSKLLDTLEVTFFVIYVFEMISKIIAHSFILRRGAYLRDPWNLKTQNQRGEPLISQVCVC
jgi:Ion transport protein